ncbi:MAG: Zn-dependent hydrolase [Thermaerobacterales bacterium]
MRINAARLMKRVEKMAQVGATPGGGVTRLALTDEDRAGRDLLGQWLREAGLTVRCDDLGNMTGRREGVDPEAPAVLIGSHCDSVKQGGRFDGALGVLAGLEVVETLNDAGVCTNRPLEIVNWTNEEGARFEPAMLASGAAAGRFSRQYVYDRRDSAGLRFEDELRRIGYLGDAAHRPGPAGAYLELHVEQGPVLEDAGIPVAVVGGIVGIAWLEVVVKGRSDHAGPTPMARRRDALAAAARIISRVPELARAQGADAMATVGRLTLEPNVINVIPGHVVFSIDFRHPEEIGLDRMEAALRQTAAEAAAANGVEIEISRFWTSEPTPFNADVTAAIRRGCEEIAVDYLEMWSGAGHDARYMADICPAGLIFARSQGGISHSEQEYTTTADIEAAVNVVLATTVELAGLANRL